MGEIGRGLFLALLFTGQICSQQAGDFSGEWRMDASRSESAHQDVPIGPVTLVIKASPTELTIETRRASRGKGGTSSTTVTFLLDGSEHATLDNSGAPIKTKARLDGTKLVTEVTRNVQGSTVTSVQSFSLDANGKELIIDKTLTVQHGYQSTNADDNNTGKGRDVFVRSRARQK